MNEQFQTQPDGYQVLVSFPYSPGEDHATIVTVVVSVFELIASVGLLAAILMSAFNTRASEDPRLFVRTHTAMFFISLVVCAVLQAVGGIMSAAWVKEMGVVAGSLCTAQAVIKHISDVGVAVWSFVIAAHSFLLLWRAGGLVNASHKPIVLFGYSMPYNVLIKWSIVAVTWGAILLIVTLGPEITAKQENGDFYGISGEWCWITDGYPVERILFAYLIMIGSAFISFVLYAGAFYHIRNKLHQEKPASEYILSNDDQADEYAVKLSRYMIWYPLAYFCCLMPVAIQRFTVWGGAEVHFGAVVFTDSVYHLLGIVHLVLFICTPRLLPPLTVFPAISFFGSGVYENERAESYAHPQHTKEKRFIKARRPPPLQIVPPTIPAPVHVAEKPAPQSPSEIPHELLSPHIDAQNRTNLRCPQGMHIGPSGRPGLPCRPGSRGSNGSSFSNSAASTDKIPSPITSPSKASIYSLSSVSSTSTLQSLPMHPRGLPARPSSHGSSQSSHSDDKPEASENPFADPLPRAKPLRKLSGLPLHPAASIRSHSSNSSNLMRAAIEQSHWSATTGTASTATATLSSYISTATDTAGTYISTGNPRSSAYPNTAMSSASPLTGSVFQMVTNNVGAYVAPHASMRIEEEEEPEDEYEHEKSPSIV